ncbi:DUF1254 domain-containing protein [Pseudomonas solani]|uniref:DUF1254 domain-containing protein n=1 Tax=Pseudomonas solani TaxID=2731552 RepID=UPI003C2B25ED
MKTSPLLRRTLLALALLVGLPALLLFSQRELIRNAAQGYLYGYPLVLTEITRDNFSADMAPINRLMHVPRFPDAGFREIVRPNVDTLYSVAWLDLEQGPLVFELPATERYNVMQFLDAWTNVFASLGPRTTGNIAGRYLLVGPRWQGEVPEGFSLLRSPTRMAWLLGRVQTNGPADYDRVHAIQAGISLTPLAQWRPGQVQASVAPPAKGRKSVPPLFQVRALDGRAFFQRLAALMADNPPRAADVPVLGQLAALGVEPGKPVAEWSWLQRQAVNLGVWLAERGVRKALANPSNLQDGWRVPPMQVGRYGEDYGLRAAVAMAGFGANLAEDAIYPNAVKDGRGEDLQGGKRYRMHFAADALPPVRAFWSLTVYDGDGFLVANPLNRFALGDRDALAFNPDGSLDILLQAEAPEGEKQSNWLPIPHEGAFSVTGRLYWPKAEILDGRWHMPPVQLQAD